MIQPWEMVKVKCPRPEDTNKNLKFVHVFPKIAEVSAGVVFGDQVFTPSEHIHKLDNPELHI